MVTGLVPRVMHRIQLSQELEVCSFLFSLRSKLPPGRAKGYPYNDISDALVEFLCVLIDLPCVLLDLLGVFLNLPGTLADILCVPVYALLQ